MPYKIDFHVHTAYSFDSFTSIKAIIRATRGRGLDGVVITDHNTMRGALEALKFKNADVAIIPGIEVSSANGHVIVAGIVNEIPWDLSLVEVAERIDDCGGLLIYPHPFDPVRATSLKLMKLARPDAIEVMNSNDPLFPLTSRLCERIADEHKIAKVAGSDAHLAEEIGSAYTIVDSSSNSIEDILTATKKCRTAISGHQVSLWTRIKKIKLRAKYGRLRRHA